MASSKLYHFEQYEPCEAKKTARNIIWKVLVHGIHYVKPYLKHNHMRVNTL